MKKQPTLLIIRMSALGDVAMTLPVIYSVARQYPQWNIKVLTQHFFSKLFVNHPENISFILAYPKGRHRGIAGLLRLIARIRKEQVDVVADFHNVLRSRIICLFLWLTGIPVAIVNKDRNGRRKLTRVKNKQLVAQTNYVLRYSHVLAQLHLPVTLTFNSLFADKGDLSLLPSVLQTAASTCRIGIAPFARYDTKTYPVQQMEQVLRILSAKGCRLFLFGSSGEEKRVLDAWAQQYPACISLPGMLELRQELILISHLDLMISMDSANMHLASLVNTPVISLWGSTTPLSGFLGWRQSAGNAICKQLPCQPCSISGLRKCPMRHFLCMKSVTPEEICLKVEEVINRQNRIV